MNNCVHIISVIRVVIDSRQFYAFHFFPPLLFPWCYEGIRGRNTVSFRRDEVKKAATNRWNGERSFRSRGRDRCSTGRKMGEGIKSRG